MSIVTVEPACPGAAFVTLAYSFQLYFGFQRLHIHDPNGV